MSTSLSPRSSPAVHPTRQQLDELDALLQRMLDLPVNKIEVLDSPETPAALDQQTAAEELPAVSYRVPESDPELPVADAATATAAAEPRAEPSPVREPDPDDWVRLASTWTPSAQTWEPLKEIMRQARPGIAPAPEAEPAPSSEASSFPDAREALAQSLAPVIAEPTAPVQNVAVPATNRSAVWQWPFVAVNVVFDVLTLPLGPLGAGLRSSAGRNVLAALGLLGFAAAAAVALADRIGWTW